MECGYNSGRTTRMLSDCRKCTRIHNAGEDDTLDWIVSNTCETIPDEKKNIICPLTTSTTSTPPTPFPITGGLSCPAGNGGSIDDGGYGWFQIDKDCRQCRNDGSWSKKLDDNDGSKPGYQSNCADWKAPNPNYSPGNKSSKKGAKCGVGSAYGCVGVAVGGDCDPQICPGMQCFKNGESGGTIYCGRKF